MTVTNTVNIITLLLINTECMVQQKENTNNRQIFPTEEKLLKWKPNIKCRKDINSEKKNPNSRWYFNPRPSVIQPDALTIELQEGYSITVSKGKKQNIYPNSNTNRGYRERQVCDPFIKGGGTAKRIPLLGQNVLTHIFNACFDFFYLLTFLYFSKGIKLNWNVSAIQNWLIGN